MTEFRDIPGFDGAYAISSDGRVLSRERKIERLGRGGVPHMKRIPEKVLKRVGPFKGHVNLYRNGVMECSKIETLMLRTFGDRR